MRLRLSHLQFRKVKVFVKLVQSNDALSGLVVILLDWAYSLLNLESSELQFSCPLTLSVTLLTPDGISTTYAKELDRAFKWQPLAGLELSSSALAEAMTAVDDIDFNCENTSRVKTK
jgi:hypothetical protein